jgi:hypothetical protein
MDLFIRIQPSLIDVLAAATLVEAFATAAAVGDGMTQEQRAMGRGALPAARELSGVIATVLRWTTEFGGPDAPSWEETMDRVRLRGFALGEEIGFPIGDGSNETEDPIAQLLRGLGIKAD